MCIRDSFRGEALPPIKSFDTSGNVIMLNSFSKTIAPGLRVGAVTAKKEWVQKLELVKQGADTHTATLPQAICAEFLRQGLLPAHLQKVAAIYEERFSAMERGIQQHFPASCEYTHPEGGLFVWARIPGSDTIELNKRAVSEYKVAFVRGQPFFINENEGADCLRLNYSSSNVEDVYKRQPFGEAGAFSTTSLKEGLCLTKNEKLIPVSYTHLDVYKRQR